MKALRGEPPDARKAARQKSSKPRIEALRRWFDDNLKRLPHKSGTAEAIRPIALGHKNWLFAGSDKGGERAAAILSLIETAKLNGIDPEAYLRDFLARIADYPINRINELRRGIFRRSTMKDTLQCRI